MQGLKTKFYSLESLQWELEHFYSEENLKVLWIRRVSDAVGTNVWCKICPNDPNMLTCECSRRVHEKVFYDKKEALRRVIEMIQVIGSFKAPATGFNGNPANLDVESFASCMLLSDAYVSLSNIRGIARYNWKDIPPAHRVCIQFLMNQKNLMEQEHEIVYIITTEGPGRPGVREFLVNPDNTEAYARCEAFFRDQ
jgi:hypothetical protein